MTDMQEDLHDSSKRFEQNKQKLKDSNKVSSENKEAIQMFINKSFAQGISKARARKYLTDFHSMLQLVDDIELLEADKVDLERLVAEIEQADYAEATKSDFKCVIKKFYKVMEGDGQKYPKKVNFLDTTIDKSEQEMPDILDKEEIDAIIDTCKNDRDRAMYKVLYEAGLRAGELMKLRVGDVSFVHSGVKLNVRGKTGNRRLLVVESERYLRKKAKSEYYDIGPEIHKPKGMHWETYLEIEEKYYQLMHERLKLYKEGLEETKRRMKNLLN